MRFRNAHSSSIDGVAPGQAGDFNPAVVKGLVDAGLLVPVEGAAQGSGAPELRAQFDAAWSEREAGYARELAAKDARITELEVELAQARLDIEAATAPADSKPAKAKG
jgi:hypothetical protein